MRNPLATSLPSNSGAAVVSLAANQQVAQGHFQLWPLVAIKYILYATRPPIYHNSLIRSGKAIWHTLQSLLLRIGNLLLSIGNLLLR